MNCFLSRLALGALLASVTVAGAQEPQARGERVEARKGGNDELWTLGDKTWDFKDVLTAYVPAKGHVEMREGQGRLAVWRLTLAKDFEDGVQRLHEELRGSPFRIMLLDAERTVINQDLPGTITPVPARAGDTIELYVALPNENILKDVKFVRVQRRTDVGF
jgi:hypothetical protein